MAIDIVGAWKLVAWRRIAEDGTATYPLGEDASGVLIYTADAKMAVQMIASNRPSIDTTDALGGDEQQRAAALPPALAEEFH